MLRKSSSDSNEICTIGAHCDRDHITKIVAQDDKLSFSNLFLPSCLSVSGVSWWFTISRHSLNSEHSHDYISICYIYRQYEGCRVTCRMNGTYHYTKPTFLHNVWTRLHSGNSVAAAQSSPLVRRSVSDTLYPPWKISNMINIST